MLRYSPPLFAGASLKAATRGRPSSPCPNSPPLFAGASLKAPAAVRQDRPAHHSPPLFVGASLKVGRHCFQAPGPRHSPPLFAGASLKVANIRIHESHRRDSPPLFAGASLKDLLCRSVHLLRCYSPPAFCGGLIEGVMIQPALEATKEFPPAFCGGLIEARCCSWRATNCHAAPVRQAVAGPRHCRSGLGGTRDPVGSRSSRAGRVRDGGRCGALLRVDGVAGHDVLLDHRVAGTDEHPHLRRRRDRILPTAYCHRLFRHFLHSSFHCRVFATFPSWPYSGWTTRSGSRPCSRRQRPGRVRLPRRGHGRLATWCSAKHIDGKLTPCC